MAVAPSGVAGNYAGGECGGGQWHGDGDDVVAGENVGRALHGKAPGDSASKKTRAACHMRAPGHGSDLIGGEELRQQWRRRLA